MQSFKNISDKRITKRKTKTLMDQTLKKKVYNKMTVSEMNRSVNKLSVTPKRSETVIKDNNVVRKMSHAEMKLSIERLSRPLKRKLVEITENKLKVAQLKKSAGTYAKTSKTLNTRGKNSLSRKSTVKKHRESKNEVKNSTNKKKSALSKKVVAVSKRIYGNATEAINNGVKDTIVQDMQDISIPVTYEIIDGERKYQDPGPQYSESIIEIEELVMNNVESTSLIIESKFQIDKTESKIDEKETLTDMIEISPKINQQDIKNSDFNKIDEQEIKPLIINQEQDSMIGEPDVKVVEPKVTIYKLERLYNELDQNPKIDVPDLMSIKPMLKINESETLYNELNHNPIIDDPDLIIDESELLYKEPEQNPKTNMPDLLIDKLHSTIDELKTNWSNLLYDESEQNLKIDEQSLQDVSFSPSFQITIGDAMDAEMHMYLHPATSWSQYFQQDLFVLGYFVFTILFCVLNYYLI